MAKPSSTLPTSVAIPPIPAILQASSLYSAVHNFLYAAMVMDTALVLLMPYAGKYFNIWKFQVQCVFCSHDLLDIVEGHEFLDSASFFITCQY
jgi:hypothetical protein